MVRINPILLTIIQTILLMGIILFLSISVIYNALIIALIVGLIPLIYAKKYTKKEILGINVISSIIVGIFLIIIFFYLSLINTSQISNELIIQIIQILDLRTFLFSGLGSLVLFNIPFLFYFFFKKEE